MSYNNGNEIPIVISQIGSMEGNREKNNVYIDLTLLLVDATTLPLTKISSSNSEYEENHIESIKFERTL